MGPDQHTDDERAARIGAILNDFLDRRAGGASVTPTDLFAQHPDLASELREHLELLREMRPLGGTIEGLIAQGVLRRSADSRWAAELGPYRITGYIGRGGMGIVLLAYEERLRRAVVLKVLRPELIEEPGALARFEREARAAAGLRHPNIVGVYAIGQERGVHYIAMEHVPGTSLAQVIRDSGSLPADTARHILRELLNGLDAAHKAGLIHRDIKPSNILLSQGGGQFGLEPADRRVDAGSRPPAQTAAAPPGVKIVDFGLARMRSSQTQLTLRHAVLGTPDYMSPEQARGEDSLDERADLYSAGVVLYEMLTGRTPFKTDTPTATLHRILHEEARDPRKLEESVDANLASLALRLMAKRREDRFQTAAEARAALDSNMRVPAPAVSRRRLLAAAGVAGLLLAVAWLSSSARDSSASNKPRLQSVVIDGRRSNVLWARYSDGTQRQFRGFAERPGIRRRDVRVLDASGQGDMMVAVAIAPDVDGNVLLGFSADGERRWGLRLDTDYAALQWPDCAPPEPAWRARALAAGDLDGVAGDELVVVGRSLDDYPTRISIIDPRSGRILHSFWHYGHLDGVDIIPDYFESSRAAIVAWGVNNKLDGFHQPQPQDPAPVVDCTRDQVPVIMILDPRDMDGVGPPHSPRLEIPPVMPWGYALLDVPADPVVTIPGTGQRIGFSESETARFTAVRLEPDTSAPPGTRRTQLWITVGNVGLRDNTRAVIVTDQNLSFLKTRLGEFEHHLPTADDWRERWHAVIQAGRESDSLPELAQQVRRRNAELLRAPQSEAAGDLITDVRVASYDRGTLLARYGPGGIPRVFHRFASDEGAIVASALVSATGGPRNLVVVGLNAPPDGDCVLAFDADGSERWRLNLSPDFRWPDCGPPTKWQCSRLAVANLDEEPGDELLVVAKDPYEYPTRLSIVDPHDGNVQSTFWHMGELDTVVVVPDFFGPGRPALLVSGLNNKLDGFEEPRADDPVPVTRYDMACVTMLLDPRDMHGAGPPHTGRLPDIEPAWPHAYALLDLPPMSMARYVPPEGGPRVTPNEAEIVFIRRAARALSMPDEEGGLWFTIQLGRPDEHAGPGILIVDRDLNLRDMVVSSLETERPGAEYWRPYWRPIIQHGAPAAPDAPGPVGPGAR